MTAVRIRHEHDIEAQHLADVPFAELSDVIPVIKSWGISTNGDDYPDLVGQFVYSDRAAYFEVIICAPEED